MFSVTSSAAIFLSDFVSFVSVASITRCCTNPRRTFLAIGITGHGNSGATIPPSFTSSRSGSGKNLGTLLATRERALAATLLSSGRTTPSMNPTAKYNPSGSASRPASRSAAGDDFALDAWVDQALASFTDCSVIWFISEVFCPIFSLIDIAGSLGWSSKKSNSQQQSPLIEAIFLSADLSMTSTVTASG